jgi:hypothetical protein
MEFFSHHICCHLSGSYVAYTASILHSFRSVMLYFARLSPHIKLNISRRFGNCWVFHSWRVSLLALGRTAPNLNIYIYIHTHIFIHSYHVSKYDFHILMFILAIVMSSHCGPWSNIDFVHFILQNFEQFSFEKFATTLLTSENMPDPKLLFVKYYGVETDGWNNSPQCSTCMLEYRNTIQPLSNCGQPTDYYCSICKMQPPSLLALATRTLFNLAFNLGLRLQRT